MSLQNEIAKARSARDVAIVYFVLPMFLFFIGIGLIVGGMASLNAGTITAGYAFIGINGILSFSLWIATLVLVGSLRTRLHTGKKVSAIVLMCLFIFPLLMWIGAIIAAVAASAIANEKEEYGNKRSYDYQDDYDRELPRRRYRDEYDYDYDHPRGDYRNSRTSRDNRNEHFEVQEQNKQKITTKNQKNLQLMFVGDSKQLNPVNDKLQFSGFEILQKQKTNPQLINFEIKEIVRNKNPIYNKLLELLRQEINNPSYQSINKVKNAFVKLNEFYQNNDLLKPMYFINNIQSLLKIYNASSLQYAPTQNYDNSEDVIISYTNYGVDSINKNINKHLLKRDEFEMIKTNDYVRLNNPLGFKIQNGWYQSLPVDSLIKITQKEFGSVYLKNHLSNKTIKLNGSLVHFSIDTKNNKNQIVSLRNDEKKPIFIFNLKGQIIDPNNPKIPNNENFTYLYNFKKYEAFMAEYRNDYANFEKKVKIYKQNFIAEAKNILGIDIVDHLLSLMDSNNPIYKTTEIKRTIQEEIKKQIEYINNNPNSKIKYFNEREFELWYIEDLKNKTINEYLQTIKTEENSEYLNNVIKRLKNLNSQSTDLFLAKMQLFDEQNKVNEVSLPYAMTIHKSQGSTYMNTYIVFDEDIYVQKGKEKRYVVQNANDYEKHQVPLNEIANKLRLWYVALSRNQNKIVIYNNEHRVNNKVVNKTQIKGLKYDDPDIVIKCINQTSLRNKDKELIKEKEEI